MFPLASCENSAGKWIAHKYVFKLEFLYQWWYFHEEMSSTQNESLQSDVSKIPLWSDLFPFCGAVSFRMTFNPLWFSVIETWRERLNVKRESEQTEGKTNSDILHETWNPPIKSCQASRYKNRTYCTQTRNPKGGWLGQSKVQLCRNSLIQSCKK